MRATLVHASGASAKTALRTVLRARRRAAATADPRAAESAAGRLPAELLGRFTVVAAYHPQGAELDPHPLMARLAQAGARLALPYAPQKHAPLVFKAYVPGEQALDRDAFGLPAPPPEAETLVPDLLILPLLAFDRRGGRMGQGAGCYDRTLEALRRGPGVFALGLAYAEQAVAAVPIEPHDQLLDAILTERAYIPAERDF